MLSFDFIKTNAGIGKQSLSSDGDAFLISGEDWQILPEEHQFFDELKASALSLLDADADIKTKDDFLKLFQKQPWSICYAQRQHDNQIKDFVFIMPF